MGFCGSKLKEAAEENKPSLATGNQYVDGMANKLQEVPLAVSVKQAKNVKNDAQFLFVKNAISAILPKAEVATEIDAKAVPEFFEVYVEGKLAHSTQKNGPVQENKSFLVTVKEIALNKMGTIF